MALILADRVRETSTTTGTGALSLAGAVVGYQTFSSAIGNTNTCYYAISNPGVAEWEVGIGTYATSGNTLTRTTIITSSNANAAVNFSAGTKDVFVTYPATKSVYLDASGNASALGTPASGTVTNLTGTASININGTVGATTPATGAFTTGTFSSTLGVTGVATLGNGAILGTPASGTVTNLTGTASININGTVGATTPAAGAFTTLSATGVATFTAAGGIVLNRTNANTALIWQNNTVEKLRITNRGDASDVIQFSVANATVDALTFTQAGAVTIPGTLAAGATTVTGPYTGMLRLNRDADAQQYAIIGTGGGETFINAYVTSGSTRYPFVIRNTNNASTVDYATFSSTGLAVTGTLDTTGNITQTGAGGGLAFNQNQNASAAIVNKKTATAANSLGAYDEFATKDNTGTTNTWASGVNINSANSSWELYNGGTRFSITQAGAVTIGGTLAAGATTVTGTVTATTTAAAAAVTINGTHATGGTFFLVQRSGVAKSYFGSSISISGVGTANDTDIYAVGDGRLFGGDQTTNFTKFTSTGLAVTGTLSATGLLTVSTTGAVQNQIKIGQYENGSTSEVRLFAGNGAAYKGWVLVANANLAGGVELLQTTAVGGSSMATTAALGISSTGAVTIPGTLAAGATTVTGTLSASGATTLATTLVVTAASNGLGVVINGRSSDNLGAMYFYANNGTTNYATITTSATEFRHSAVPAASVQTFYTNASERMRIDASGNVGIGVSPSYQLQVNTDSAGKPGVGGLWTVVSDERIKSNIVPANLDRCYEIVKSVPLKHFGFAPGVYTDDQIKDKHNLGWIAQDVQKVFKNAVSVKPFTLKTDIPDGTEDYEEQDFTLEAVEKTETSIQVINGKPVQVSKVVTSENKVMLFDTVDVLDEAGAAVMDGDKPLTYQMPRMVKKTKPKVRHDVIEDCLDLNGGQMIAALYGCVQALMAKVEALENK